MRKAFPVSLSTSQHWASIFIHGRRRRKKQEHLQLGTVQTTDAGQTTKACY